MQFQHGMHIELHCHLYGWLYICYIAAAKVLVCITANAASDVEAFDAYDGHKVLFLLSLMLLLEACFGHCELTA